MAAARVRFSRFVDECRVPTSAGRGVVVVPRLEQVPPQAELPLLQAAAAGLMQGAIIRNGWRLASLDLFL